jgi:hypothetical protein
LAAPRVARGANVRNNRLVMTMEQAVVQISPLPQ